MDLLFRTCLVVNKDGAGEVPTEIQVIPAGRHETEKGVFVLDREAAQAVMAAFAAKQNDLVVDYEHQTLSGKEAPAAGWIKKLVDRGEAGIWAVVEWTERARQYIANKEYRYLSPVFLVRRADRRVHRLAHAGLTNDPAIDGMVPIVAKAGLEMANNEEDSMNKILAALGLQADATEDQALAAVEALRGQATVVANKKVLETLGLKEGASESEVTGTIVAMKQSHEQQSVLAQEVQALKANLAARDAGDLVAQAMKEGKVTPAQEPWARDYATRDPEGFKVFAAKAPVVLVQQEVAGGTRPAGGAGSLEETQLLINRQLGLDAETFKKYNAVA